MFGLTRREQRWKAEQQAAEIVLGFAAGVVRSAADVRIAEERAELERLRKENAERSVNVMSEAEWTLRQIAQLDPATTSTATAVLFARTTLDRLAHQRAALGVSVPAGQVKTGETPMVPPFLKSKE